MKLLGVTDDIQKFDDYRTKAKSARDKGQSGSFTHWTKRCQTVENKIKTQVLRKDGDLRKQITEEQKIGEEDNAGEALSYLYQAKRLSERLLKYWNLCPT